MKENCSVATNLQGSLQNSNWERLSGLSRQPKTKIWMRFVQFLNLLLKLKKPANQEMTILQHQPLTASDGSFEKEMGKLKRKFYFKVSSGTSGCGALNFTFQTIAIKWQKMFRHSPFLVLDPARDISACWFQIQFVQRAWRGPRPDQIPGWGWTQ